MVRRMKKPRSWLLRRALPGEHVPAVQAHPAARGVGEEQAVLLQQLRQLSEPLGVGLFDLGDGREGGRNLRKALLPGRLGKGGIDRFKLLQLIVLRHAQQLGGVLRRVHGIAAGDVHRPAGERLEMVVKDLGVGQLLRRGEGEHRLDHVQLLSLGLLCRKGVAAAGLTFSRERPHQIFRRPAVFQLHKSITPSPPVCAERGRIMRPVRKKDAPAP